jgi:hypothetical protein
MCLNFSKDQNSLENDIDNAFKICQYFIAFLQENSTKAELYLTLLGGENAKKLHDNYNTFLNQMFAEVLNVFLKTTECTVWLSDDTKDSRTVWNRISPSIDVCQKINIISYLKDIESVFYQNSNIKPQYLSSKANIDGYLNEYKNVIAETERLLSPAYKLASPTSSW